MKLYELTGLYAGLQDILEEEGGELTPERECDLNELTERLEDKLESMGGLIRNLELEAKVSKAKADLIKQEAKKHEDRAKAIENRVESLEKYVLACLKSAGIDKLKTDSFKYHIKVSEAVEVPKGEELKGIPEEFIRIKYSEELDKAALLKHWKTLEDKEQARQFGNAVVVARESLQVK